MPPSDATPRILIFIVAYNAKTTLSWVLDRIPASLRRENVEVLVIDDSSPDDTFQTGVEYAASHRDDSGLAITVCATPKTSATAATRSSATATPSSTASISSRSSTATASTRPSACPTCSPR